MGRVIIQEDTIERPITLMGKESGVCWGADTCDDNKNFMRGLNCIKSGHGRVMEYPQVYMVLDGYSARVIREFYTHISGGPTRLQASTRYINYQKGFDFIVPPSIAKDPVSEAIYKDTMQKILDGMKVLIDKGVPREDVGMMLPLAMETKVVVRTNLRNLVDMSHQRMCTRAFWEYRELMDNMCSSLTEYSSEWAYLVSKYFKPKCDVTGYCVEDRCCGRNPKAE